MRTSLKIFPRNASCPPRGRGNERFLLSFNGCTRSARLPELSVPGAARVRFFALPRYNHRALRLQKLPFPPRGRGNERFLLSFIGCARSARLPELSVPRLRAGEILCILVVQSSRAAPAETPVLRPARMPRNHFPRCNPRALLEIKDNRLPLHKHSVSTYPLSLLSAFPQNLTVPRGERTLPPRPSPQSGRAGYSRRGSAPQGEPFRHLSLRWER